MSPLGAHFSSWPINRALLWELYPSGLSFPHCLESYVLTNPAQGEMVDCLLFLPCSVKFIYFQFLETENCMLFSPPFPCSFFFLFFFLLHFLSLNASSPCPSCSEPNVLDDSQGLAAEGSLSRYSVKATCLWCLFWETSCSLSPPSLCLLRFLLPVLVPISIPRPVLFMSTRAWSQRCSRPSFFTDSFRDQSQIV